jgi:FMN reductase
MTKPRFSFLGVSGSLSRPSRTSSLVGAVLGGLQELEHADARLIEIADIVSDLFPAASFDRLPARGRAIIEEIEAADLLVVGTPVYRASYTGAFKHLFDLVRHDRLKGKPIILTATGGSQLHGLVTEHQLRPLFGFFGALSLPTTIYATEADFSNYLISSGAIRQRIAAASEEAVQMLRPAASNPFNRTARLAVAASA